MLKFIWKNNFISIEKQFLEAAWNERGDFTYQRFLNEV